MQYVLRFVHVHHIFQYVYIYILLCRVLVGLLVECHITYCTATSDCVDKQYRAYLRYNSITHVYLLLVNSVSLNYIKDQLYN